MITSQTNVDSMMAQTNLKLNQNFQSKTIQQLTSGCRINKSGDDAALLAMQTHSAAISQNSPKA